MKKRMKFSFIVTLTVVFLLASSLSAATMPMGPYASIGQGFDHLTNEDIGNYVFALGPGAAKEIVEGGNSIGGNALMLKSASGTQVHEGVKLLSYTDADRAANVDAEAIVFWMKVDDPAPPNDGKTQFQVMIGERDPNNLENMGAVYFFNHQPFDYHTVDKDGNVVHDNGAYVAVESGFEGIVIIPLDEFENHPAYPDPNGQFDPDEIFMISFDIHAATADAPYYFDDLGLTSDIQGLITYLTEEPSETTSPVDETTETDTTDTTEPDETTPGDNGYYYLIAFIAISVAAIFVSRKRLYSN